MKDTDITTPLERVRKAYAAGKTRPLSWRREQLERIEAMLSERESEWNEALQADLGKGAFESFITEVGLMAAEVAHARKHLNKWTKPRKVRTSLFATPGKSWIVPEPLGVNLIIGPWNYPLHLMIAPLVPCLAAGNVAVLKPSEIASHTADAVARIFPEYLDPDCVQVIQGGVPETTALLEEQFDHIFYTGNGTVGRIIMTAAAKHLTPVTLELGGKSPTIVDESADLGLAARRITWAKCLNAGQTCIAPDYLLVHERVHDELLSRIEHNLKKFYGDDVKASKDFARVISDKHFERLSKLLDSGDTHIGGITDPSQRFISPTVLANVSPDSPAMQEEIFGPILPVLKVKSVDEANGFITARPKPLALYVFADDERVQQSVIDHTTSGAVVINDCMTHFAVPDLPFGGVGASGMGAYHGQHGFDQFSHLKAVLKKSKALDVRLRYPPYSKKGLSLIKKAF